MAHAQPQHTSPDSSIHVQDIETARRAEYVAFLSRHPFATDAHELGFVTGIREDCRLQTDHLRNVDIPLGMLDNDFKNPDLKRYLETFRTHEPEIGVIGDAPTPDAAHRYVDAARELKADFPDATLIIVPKCHEAIAIIGDAEVPGTPLVLGYSMGYSDILANEFSDYANWRGQRVHLLGASPPKQWNAIQQLTQPTLTGDPPADIVGLDWNGPHKVAYNGESWSRDGWQRADQLSIRSTVRRSLREMRAYWEDRGVWPTMPTLRDCYGPAVREPDDPVWAATGGDIYEPDALPGPDEWETRVDYDDDETSPLEHAIVVSYDDGRTLAYRSQTERDHVEYYEGLWDSVVEERV
ncbi:DUF6610 family protein [Halomarina salina]|uniref:DUF6610 family protein n=1 Tax=Halomarina salina TaxID=1872699 RepID=A0ABD5RTG3_9EURY|nr:DUF6610 family protein [Halomarina salina]